MDRRKFLPSNFSLLLPLIAEQLLNTLLAPMSRLKVACLPCLNFYPCCNSILELQIAQKQTPFRKAQITKNQKFWNKAMSKIRISLGYFFGDIVKYFKFYDFHKSLKIQLIVVERMYIVCVLLQNACSHFYGSIASDYFGLEPQNVESYFNRPIININISS